MLTDFLESTYAAAADLAKWDRSALEREPVAVPLDQRQGHSDELLLDDADRSRRSAKEIERRDLGQGGVEEALGALVHDHHQAGFVAEPTLDDALHGDPVATQHIGDPRQDAGTVGDLEVQVVGRGDVGDDP